ncbi:stress responsive a b barrel domain-containing protein [Phlyctema vagabunda]|uniref:Stress responsive a b barrel domain-containing protein n=1 Tax=Phlyctema vagabunda TaxID=108571 RepID=A0ABR4PDZ8_9HELO
MTIQRVTLFNIPRPDDITTLIEQYRTLQKTAFKDGKPYVVDLQAGPTLQDARTQGYTLAVRTAFHTLDDMRYYDNECEAHKAFKRAAASKREGDVLVVYFEDQVNR